MGYIFFDWNPKQFMNMNSRSGYAIRVRNKRGFTGFPWDTFSLIGILNNS